MQFNTKRREFLKLGMASLSYPFSSSPLRFAVVAESLYSVNSFADSVCGQITVDSTIFTIDSTLSHVSYSASASDTDCDGLTDTDEESVYGTNQLLADTDGDGLGDGVEINVHGTNPLSVDTDGDGYSDYDEILFSSDPLDPNSQIFIPDGDVNGDGNVDAGDVVSLQGLVLGRSSPTEEQLEHGDVAPLVNGRPSPDGKLTAGDLAVLSRKVLGLIDF